MLKAILMDFVRFGLLAAYTLTNQAWAGNILTVYNWFAIVLCFAVSGFVLLAIAVSPDILQEFPPIKRNWFHRIIFLIYVVLLAGSGFVITSFAIVLAWVAYLFAMKVVREYHAEAANV